MRQRNEELQRKKEERERQKQEEIKKKQQTRATIKEQEKSRLELSKMKKQGLNQSKANAIRLEKTVGKHFLRKRQKNNRKKNTGYAGIRGAAKARNVAEKIWEEKGNTGKRA